MVNHGCVVMRNVVRKPEPAFGFPVKEPRPCYLFVSIVGRRDTGREVNYVSRLTTPYILTAKPVVDKICRKACAIVIPPFIIFKHSSNSYEGGRQESLSTYCSDTVIHHRDP
jgi:hypothetical protein